MFHRHRRRRSLLHVILAFLGLGLFHGARCRRRMAEGGSDAAGFRAKMKEFRHKIREALNVWEDSEGPGTGPSAENGPEPAATEQG